MRPSDQTPGVGTFTYPAYPSAMTIAGDGYAYLSYQSIESTGTVQRAAAQPYPDGAYDVFDQLLGDTNGSNFTAAVADLTALWQSIGQSYNANDPLLEALQASNRTSWSSQDSVETLSTRLVNRFELPGTEPSEMTVVTT